MQAVSRYHSSYIIDKTALFRYLWNLSQWILFVVYYGSWVYRCLTLRSTYRNDFLKNQFLLVFTFIGICISWFDVSNLFQNSLLKNRWDRKLIAIQFPTSFIRFYLTQYKWSQKDSRKRFECALKAQFWLWHQSVISQTTSCFSLAITRLLNINSLFLR